MFSASGLQFETQPAFHSTNRQALKTLVIGCCAIWTRTHRVQKRCLRLQLGTQMFGTETYRSEQHDGTPVKHLGSAPGPGATAGTWQGQLLVKEVTTQTQYRPSMILHHPDHKDFLIVFTLRVTQNLLMCIYIYPNMFCM